MDAKKLENYSYDDFIEISKSFGENERAELIFGQIYMMSGANALHQDLVLNIAILLKQIDKEKKCHPRIAPFDLKIKCAGSINVVQPDIMLFCEDKKFPCAVFEVLSPTTAYKDKSIKKELYEICGIKEYCIVSPEYSIVDLYRLKDNKYELVKSLYKDDILSLECLEKDIDLKEVFTI